MPLLRTDDAPRRLRAVWLGPRGARFWVEWTYVRWAVFVGLIPPLAGVVLVVVWPADPQLAGMACVPWGAMASYGLTRWIMARTDYDRPLRYWRWVLRSEWRHSRRVPGECGVRVAAPVPVALSPGVRHALYSARSSRPRRLGLTEVA